MTAILVLVWGRLARAAVRLKRFYGLWLAGKVPAPRKSGGQKAPAEGAVRPVVPRGRGWLAIRIWETRAFGSQLQHLLTDPQFVAFVAAVPRAGGVLRPILRMLTVDALPAVLGMPVGLVAGPVKMAGVVGRKRERPSAALVSAGPRKVLPRLAKGAWFAPPGKNWGSGG